MQLPHDSAYSYALILRASNNWQIINSLIHASYSHSIAKLLCKSLVELHQTSRLPIDWRSRTIMADIATCFLDCLVLPVA